MDVAEFHQAEAVDYFTYERGAERVREWSNHVIPGLVQTRPYAEALLRGGWGLDEPTVQAKAAYRVARQRETLARSRVDLIVDESVLHREVGGPEVMRGQLVALLDLPANVSLRVVPFTVGAHQGVDGPFILLDGPCRVLFLEHWAQDRTLVGAPLRVAYEDVWRALEAVAVPGGPVVEAAIEWLTNTRP